MRRLWTLALAAFAFSVACSGTAVKLACSTDTDCFKGYRCDATQTKVCLRACDTSSQTTACLTLQYCDAPSGSSEGVCRDGAVEPDTGGGDPNGGDPNPGDH